MKKQSGFGVYALLAVVVIAGLVGFAVWRVTSTKEDKTSNSTNTATTSQTENQQLPATNQKTEAAADPTATWKSFTDPTYNFTIKYPEEWARQVDNLDMCAEGLIMLAPTKEELGRCASDSGGRVMVVANKQSDSHSYALDKAYYKDVTVTDVTASGIAGKKYKAVEPKIESEGIGPEPGSVIIHYVYVKNGKEFALLYTQAPKASDEQAVVEIMATKGFSF